MSYVLFIAYLLALPITLFAADIKTTATADLSNCSVRLSSSKMSALQSSPKMGQGFCSGTVLAKNIIITAAHCLNEAVVSDTVVEAAFGASANSEKMIYSEAEDQIVLSEVMKTKKARQNFLTKGLIAEINEDYTILKIKSDIVSFKTESCPKLPTISDCGEFEKYLQTKSNTDANLTSEFYISKVVSSGSGAGAKDVPYPYSKVVASTVNLISKNKSYHFLQASFLADNKNVALKKGDSGSGLIWKFNDQKLVVGVLSATPKDGSKGYFVSVCDHVALPSWQQFNNRIPSSIKNIKRSQK